MTPELEFGIFQMSAQRPSINWNRYLDRMVDEAQLCDELGYDEYWIGEHHSAGHELPPDSLMFLSRVAEVTSNIRLGPMTVNLPYDINDPFNTAERLAFLDHLSHGRAMYGYGAGALPRDMDMFVEDMESQKDNMWEAIDAVEKYTHAEEPTDFDGEFYQYEDRLVQLPPLQEDPQSVIAGLTSPGSFSGAIEGGHRAACIAFSPMEVENNPNALTLSDMADAIEQGARNIGRDPQEAHQDFTISREVYVADSKEQALEDIGEGVKDYYDYLFGLGDGGLIDLATTRTSQTREDLTVEWMAENFPFIYGSPEDCIKQIKYLYEHVDGFGTLLINSHDWAVPEPKWRESLRRFADEVMPAFQPRKGPREHERRQVAHYKPVELEEGENPFVLDNKNAVPVDD